jgi:phosphoribosylformylglycinamidine synthase subunit PurL
MVDIMKKTKIHIVDLLDQSITEEYHAHGVGLTDEEYERLKRLLGRKPNKVELGIVGALWSEHCSYKSTKAYLSRLPSKGKNVLVGPGENAGVIDIGDNLAVVFKIESHNHPSFIEPFHGAATGVGGILRDIFTMGARPFAVANLLRFGEPSHPKTASLFHGVVSGIASYGNCFGVPTVLSNIDFHKSYNGNILVNAFAVGVVSVGDIFLAEASGVKNRLIYVGAKTGRDGIMGAVMASDSFTDDVEQKRPTVQVGDPFTEKLLLEACLKAFKEKLVVGIQDMGAAGLTSSSFEMASKASTGLSINLDHVPLRDATMSAYDIMLSESQERMLMVVKPDCVARLREIFTHYDVDCVDIGHITGDGLVRIHYQGHEVVNMSATLITENAPRYRRSYLSDIPSHRGSIKDGLVVDVAKALESFKNDLAQKDFSYVTDQFDHHIGLNTIVGPNEAEASLIRVPKTNKAVALSLVGLGKLARINPAEAARRAVYQAALEVSCQGATPVGITNCLNFGSPENIKVMTDLRWVIDGMAEAAIHLDVPIVSGNVSLYNETNGQPILPTLALGLVGLTDQPFHYTKCSRGQNGDLLVSLGEIPDDYAGCEAVLDDTSQSTSLRQWDHETIMRLCEVLKEIIHQDLIRCTSVIGHGGLLKSLIKIMANSGLGAVIDFGTEWLEQELSIGLVSENSPQVLLSIPARRLDDLSQACANKVALNLWGSLGGDHCIIRHGERDVIREPLQGLSSCYLNHVGELFANA